MISPGERAALTDLVRRLETESGLVVALTGAGVSAASGIPTFRGPEGYWTRGSKVHVPEELATFATFRRDPELVWSWYLHRRAVCRAARPSRAHEALARLDRRLGDRFLLVTQNVDGLHRRAGHARHRLYEIHGDIERMRPASGGPTRPIPEEAVAAPPGEPLSARTLAALSDERGGWMRPHVLWFDECYDEEHFRWNSAHAAIERACLLLVAGSSGATNLPNRLVDRALSLGLPILDVNPERGRFAEAAERSRGGLHLAGAAAEILPDLAALLGV